MKLTAFAVAGLIALAAAGPAQADVMAPPAPSYFHQGPFSLTPQSEADDIRREIADLDYAWGSLSPADRNARLTQIQNQLTKLDFETRNMPQNEKAGVDAILLPSLGHLAVLVGKAQGPGQPCYFPACLPGL
jgi:hypothetical protein